MDRKTSACGNLPDVINDMTMSSFNTLNFEILLFDYFNESLKEYLIINGLQTHRL